jgi:hypothetical protein
MGQIICSIIFILFIHFSFGHSTFSQGIEPRMVCKTACRFSNLDFTTYAHQIYCKICSLPFFWWATHFTNVCKCYRPFRYEGQSKRFG